MGRHPVGTGIEEIALIKGLSGTVSPVLLGMSFKVILTPVSGFEITIEVRISVIGLSRVFGNEISLPARRPVLPPDT